MHTNTHLSVRCSRSYVDQLLSSIPRLCLSLFLRLCLSVCGGVIPPPRLQASSQQSAAARAARQSQDALQQQQSQQRSQEASPEDEPDLSTLSLAQKMALFNRLAQPATRVTRARPDTRQRRSNARYQTQPITLGDMEQVGLNQMSVWVAKLMLIIGTKAPLSLNGATNNVIML